ncbi:helix-turn-helix domain-containing protein [Mariniflexile gromovii]|uniref:Helix-turn-helix domain-containing protein n=1 Tax=Mariniflexile gromovii TaxID=362523 RepID=A0ABS4BPZ0_9FLAO|nr:helix-turn-helix domain-containing protein [Mariniflexile gromovii]MBP0902655.1 helix-turn-helix domain-containing protein [Mariniflexile gromovii]
MDTILILDRLDRLEKLLIGNKEVLTFDEASDYTGISRSYLYKLTASGKIPHSKPNGKMVFFDKTRLVDWLLQHKREPELNIKGSTQAGNLSNKNA